MKRSAKSNTPRESLLGSIRSGCLDIVAVWLFISFFRLFIVENYRIPTGSMTPTLIGGEVARIDLDGDGDRDYALVAGPAPDDLIFFLNYGKGYEWRQPLRVAPELRRLIENHSRTRYDHIIVSKFAYWLRRPSRGEIAVFKAPPSEYSREAPIYVKRIVGLPEETVAIRRYRLFADGRPVETPDFFAHQRYDPRRGRSGGLFPPTRLDEGEYLFFGDNTLNSHDSREWGPARRENIKGKVVFRYWPLTALGFPH